MPVIDEIYPLSTQNAGWIPLDVIKPLAITYLVFGTGFSDLVLSANTNLAAIWASEHCLLDLSNTATTIVSGTTYNNWLFIPKDSVVMVTLPTATIKVRGLTASGRLVIQGIQRWSALALPRQINTKTS